MRSFVLIFSLFLSISSAFADEKTWAMSFDENNLLTYFPEKTEKIMVLAAGSENEDLTDLYKNFLEKLKQSLKFKLIMDNSSLDTFTDEKDSKIIETAANYPVDIIAIIRVFADSENKFGTAVCIIYNKDGSVFSALTLEKGTIISANQIDVPQKNEEVKSDSKPVVENREVSKVKTTDAVDKVLKENKKKYQLSVDEYNRKFIGLLGWDVFDGSTLQHQKEITIPYIGKYKKKISWEEFCKITGSKDLADKVSFRKTLRWGYMFGGGIAAIAGGVVLLVLDPTAKKDEVTDQRKTGPLGYTGLVMMLLGLTVAPLSFTIPDYSPDSHEALEIIDKYNTNLRKELGVEENSGFQESKKEDNRFEFSLTPMAVKDGIGFGLRLNF